jgi:hypothetical protein
MFSECWCTGREPLSYEQNISCLSNCAGVKSLETPSLHFPKNLGTQTWEELRREVDNLTIKHKSFMNSLVKTQGVSSNRKENTFKSLCNFEKIGVWKIFDAKYKNEFSSFQ